ncbi:uncharacterized protein LOC108474900 [Gossypium arboreum]|uniref:uncharacterized protein LOC108474900 n=1 Tax=Gossypium arboreum TaxID=29729 RepID=UPI0008196B2C|nr:uncharacterized protein LOC108474900 [Gossypium arboreum]
MVEGTPMGTYVLKMIGYIESLKKLGFPLSKEMATDVILQSLTYSFSQFFLNFNMNEISKTFPQLLNLLRIANSNMKRAGPKPILMVCKDKGKRKLNVSKKPKDNGKAKPNKGKTTLKLKGGIDKE